MAIKPPLPIPDPTADSITLFAGTEIGLYVSFDDGENWQSLQLNLPVVPIADLAIHKREKDLVAATQGRAFWVLDDVAPLSGPGAPPVKPPPPPPGVPLPVAVWPAMTMIAGMGLFKSVRRRRS